VGSGEGTREEEILSRDLPYHQVYNVYEDKRRGVRTALLYCTDRYCRGIQRTYTTYTQMVGWVCWCVRYRLVVLHGVLELRVLREGPLARQESRHLDRLRVGWRGVPREQKMLKGHLPRVIYHRDDTMRGQWRWVAQGSACQEARGGVIAGAIFRDAGGAAPGGGFDRRHLRGTRPGEDMGGGRDETKRGHTRWVTQGVGWSRGPFSGTREGPRQGPLSSEDGTYKTARTSFWS